MTVSYGFANDPSGGSFALWDSLIDALLDLQGPFGGIIAAPTALDGQVTALSATQVQQRAFTAVVQGQVINLSGTATYTVPDNTNATAGSTRYDAVTIVQTVATGVLTLGYRTGGLSAYAAGSSEQILALVNVPSHLSGAGAVTPTVLDGRQFVGRNLQLAPVQGRRPAGPRQGELLIDGAEGLIYDGTSWGLGIGGPWVDVALSAASPTAGSQSNVPLTKTAGSNVDCPVITSGSITIPTAEGGRWRIECQGRFNASGTAGQAALIIVVNGSNIVVSRQTLAASTSASVLIARTILLSAGDVINVQVLVGAAGIALSASAAESFVSLYRQT